jgi:MFS family permease
LLAVIRSFLALLITTTFLTMGGGLLSSLLSINMRLYGSSDLVIGLVMSCNYLGIVMGIFFCQPIVSHVGHIRAFAVFGAVNTVVALLHGLYLSPLFWALLRLCSGLCVTGLFMVIESWLNEKVAPSFRSRLLSIYMILVYFGIGIGQQLLNVSDVQGKTLFMIVAIVYAVCLVPISSTRAVNPQPLKVPRYNLVKLFQLAPISMVGTFTAGMINSSFYAMGPIFGLDIGLQVSQVSLFMSLTVWSGLVFQFPVGLLSDRLDRLLVLGGIGFLITLVSLAIAILGGTGMGVLLVLTVCFGVVFSIYPVSMARAQDNLEKADIVPVSAALILFFGIGACVGPLTASAFIALVGPWGLYVFTAFCGCILGLAAWGYRKKKPVSVEEQVAFVPIPRTSPVVSHFDPRHEAEDEPPETGVSEARDREVSGE